MFNLATIYTTCITIFTISFTFRDNIPTVHLRSWSLKCTTFDGDKAAGLVPTLFAADPEGILATLDRSWIGLQHDVVKLNKVIFSPEGVSLKESHGLLKKPR